MKNTVNQDLSTKQGCVLPEEFRNLHPNVFIVLEKMAVSAVMPMSEDIVDHSSWAAILKFPQPTRQDYPRSPGQARPFDL